MTQGFGAVCAVIVTYQTGPDFRNHLRGLMPQVSRAILIDNGSGPDTLAMLHRLVEEHDGRAELHSHSLNNLAAAQNRGIELALAHGADWVLLLDDDSAPATDMIEAMRRHHAAHTPRTPLALLAPRIINTRTGETAAYTMKYGGVFFRRVRPCAATMLENPLFVIASGSLMQAEAIRATGAMEEDFAIDYVDCDYALRLRRRGYAIHVVPGAVLYHRPGRRRMHRFLRWQIAVNHYGAQRRYTIYRNRLRSWRRHAWHCPSFVAFDLVAMGADLGKLMLFEGQKLRKLLAMLRGIRDALFSAAPLRDLGQVTRDQG